MLNAIVEVETPALVIGAVEVKVIATKIDTAYVNDLIDSAFTVASSVSLDSIAANAPNGALNSLIGGLVTAL
jgi:hypothetical protein